MEDAKARRKAAAEARRAKVLARGDARLAKITGSVEPEPGASAGAAKIQAAAPQPGPAAPAAAIATTAAAAPEPSLAAEFGTAMRKSTSTQSLPDQQRAKGTATNAKWARYDSTAPRGPRRLRAVHGGETLSAAVLSTGRLRLLVAALLALLLAAHWDAAAVASTAGSGAPPVAPGPLAEIATRVQGLLHQARQAAAPLLGSQTKPQAAEAAACQRCKQLLAPALGRVQGQVAAAAAQQPLTAWQRLRARALPAAAKAAHASCHLYGQARGQLAVLRAGDVSPAQAARAAAASLARHLHAQLAAAVASPLGQQALAVLDRMPPLAAVLLADLSLVGAAAAAMVAAPSLVHSTLELDLQAPGLVARLAAWVPGLTRQLSLAGAGQRLLTGLLDDAAAFVLAQAAYYHLPALLAGRGDGGASHG